MSYEYIPVPLWYIGLLLLIIVSLALYSFLATLAALDLFPMFYGGPFGELQNTLGGPFGELQNSATQPYMITLLRRLFHG